MGLGSRVYLHYYYTTVLQQYICYYTLLRLPCRDALRQLEGLGGVGRRGLVRASPLHREELDGGGGSDGEQRAVARDREGGGLGLQHQLAQQRPRPRSVELERRRDAADLREGRGWVLTWLEVDWS